MEDNTIKILITGDFCPINRTEKLALEKNFESIFNNFTDVLSGNDINITDLECPLTRSGKPRPKIGPHQKAHPDCIEVLKYGKFNLAALANNHIMDYDGKGARETIELCRSNGIDTVGIGMTRQDAAKPFLFNNKGKSIAIFNYADNEFLAAKDGSVMCNPIDPVLLYHDIINARKSNDFVIVILHAGNEFYELPSPRTKKLYRYIIDLGADAVIAHHTHSLSGYEIYRSRPIFYGLGNFVYDWPGKLSIEWNYGYVVRLLLSDKVTFDIIPIEQSGAEAGVSHLSSCQTTEFQKRIDHLSNIIADDTLLELEFKKYCESIFPSYDAHIEPYFGRYISILRNRGFFPKIMGHRKRLLLLNIIRCESHRDVLLRMLEQQV